MVPLWNAANGPSIHAELVGWAWVKLGHQILVAQKEERTRRLNKVCNERT